MANMGKQPEKITNTDLHAILKIAAPPNFVKTASDYDLGFSAEPVQPEFCADPTTLSFPCHTPAATWLSKAAFLLKKNSLPQYKVDNINKRLDYFTQIHGITDSVNRLKEKMAAYFSHLAQEEQAEKAANAESNDLIGNRAYPIRNPAELNSAVSYYMTYRDYMPYDDRRALAIKILDKAAAFNTKLGQAQFELEKTAGNGLCSVNDCLNTLISRIYATKGPGKNYSPLQESLVKLADAIAKNRELVFSSQFRVKLARVIDEFDRHYKLKDQYSGVFLRPEEALFGITRDKLAFAEKCVATITGVVFRPDDLEKIPLDEIKELFGEEVAEELTKDGLRLDPDKAADVIPTLPRDDADAFVQLAEKHGIQPVMETTAEPVEIVDDELAELAEKDLIEDGLDKESAASLLKLAQQPNNPAGLFGVPQNKPKPQNQNFSNPVSGSTAATLPTPVMAATAGVTSGKLSTPSPKTNLNAGFGAPTPPVALDSRRAALKRLGTAFIQPTQDRQQLIKDYVEVTAPLYQDMGISRRELQDMLEGRISPVEFWTKAGPSALRSIYKRIAR